MNAYHLGQFASTSRDRLPKLDTVSFRVSDPAEPSEVVAFAFWVDRDSFVCQTVQHSIQIVHLEVDHCFLCRREVCIVLLENGEDDFGSSARKNIPPKPVIEAMQSPMRNVCPGLRLEELIDEVESLRSHGDSKPGFTLR